MQSFGDGLGLQVNSANAQGLVIHSRVSKTSNPACTPNCTGLAAGGLSLGGGGYNGDLSSGWLLAGATFDGGTMQAMGHQASGIYMAGGNKTFFINTALTLGASFEAATTMALTATGAIYLPLLQPSGSPAFLCIDMAGIMYSSTSVCH